MSQTEAGTETVGQLEDSGGGAGVQQMVAGASGQPQNEVDMVTGGAVTVTAVLDAQHHWTHHLIQATEVEVLRLEEVGAVGVAGRLLQLFQV